MKINVDENKKIINYDEVIDFVSNCENTSELADLVSDLTSHTKAKDIDISDASILLNQAKNKLLSLSKTLEKPARKLTLKPTAVSNHSGTVTAIFIIFNLSITAVMFTLLYIAKVIG